MNYDSRHNCAYNGGNNDKHRVKDKVRGNGSDNLHDTDQKHLGCNVKVNVTHYDLRVQVRHEEIGCRSAHVGKARHYEGKKVIEGHSHDISRFRGTFNRGVVLSGVPDGNNEDKSIYNTGKGGKEKAFIRKETVEIVNNKTVRRHGDEKQYRRDKAQKDIFHYLFVRGELSLLKLLLIENKEGLHAFEVDFTKKNEHHQRENEGEYPIVEADLRLIFRAGHDLRQKGVMSRRGHRERHHDAGKKCNYYHFDVFNHSEPPNKNEVGIFLYILTQK